MSIQVFKIIIDIDYNKQIEFLESASIPGLKRRLERIIASYENES